MAISKDLNICKPIKIGHKIFFKPTNKYGKFLKLFNKQKKHADLSRSAETNLLKTTNALFAMCAAWL